MEPKILTIFNNKGGVGKTTLTFHLAHALGLRGKKTLVIDLDPQCNFSIAALPMEDIHDIWSVEDDYIEDFAAAKQNISDEDFVKILNSKRSVHFLLKPTEDGTAEINKLPPVVKLAKNVDLIPGRLTLHLYEAKLAERWSGVYQGDPLAIRTSTRIRSLSYEYSKINNYEFVIFDTSPSLGALNRNLLSLADGFIIPCNPDIFSVYGIRNIGSALETWRRQFESIFHFISEQKRDAFPRKFVRFMGYTLYNAKKRSGATNELDLARAHYNYAKQIPDVILKYINNENMIHIDEGLLKKSIGDDAVIHSHNTFPAMSQKYHVPVWDVPNLDSLEAEDRMTVIPNRDRYEQLKSKYLDFVDDFLKRVEYL